MVHPREGEGGREAGEGRRRKAFTGKRLGREWRGQTWREMRRKDLERGEGGREGELR